MAAASMESHEIWSKSGICEKKTCATPNMTMYGVLEILQGSACPLPWKQFALLMASMLMDAAMV